MAKKNKYPKKETPDATTGNYPGKVQIPYTIGKAAVPGTIPEGQTQKTFISEAEYQKLANEKKKGLQEQSIQQAQQEAGLQKQLEDLQNKPITVETPAVAEQLQEQPKSDSLLKKIAGDIAPGIVASNPLLQPLSGVVNQVSNQMRTNEVMQGEGNDQLKRLTAEGVVVGGAAIGGTGFGVVRLGQVLASSATVTTKLTAAYKLFSLKSIVGTLASVGGAGVLITRKANEATTILSSSLTGMEDVTKGLESGDIDYNTANQLMNEYEANIASAEASTKRLSSLPLVSTFLGLKDNLVKFQYARMPTGIPALRRRLEVANLQGQIANVQGQREQTRAGIFR